jgi:hypothetical protein
MVVSQFGISQETFDGDTLRPIEREIPMIVPIHMANDHPFYFYKSLEKYKVIIPLKYKRQFRKPKGLKL